MPTDDALTIGEAAALLRTSRPWVHQLLAAGELAGPTYSGAKAPPNAPRVWRESLQRYQDTHTRRVRQPKPKASDSAEIVNRDTLMRMKVALDAMVEQVQADHDLADQVAAALEAAVAGLQSQRQIARRYEQIVIEQSAILTQLLGPTDPRELLTGSTTSPIDR